MRPWRSAGLDQLGPVRNAVVGRGMIFRHRRPQPSKPVARFVSPLAGRSRKKVTLPTLKFMEDSQ